MKKIKTKVLKHFSINSLHLNLGMLLPQISLLKEKIFLAY